MIRQEKQTNGVNRLFFRVFTVVCVCVGLLQLSGCKKDSEDNGAPTDVYITTYEGKDGRNIPKLWKNGQATVLPDKKYGAFTSGLFVSGSDVYVSGSIDNNSKLTAALWKNGEIIDLEGGTRANSVFVTQGGDIYVMGFFGDYIYQSAAVWKNGLATPGFTGYSIGNAAKAAVEYKGEIYVLGWEKAASKVWKDGIEVKYDSLPLVSNAIYASGNDLYIVGHDYKGDGLPYAMVWKNGVRVNVSDVKNSSATSIFVSGKDVYIVGYSTSSGVERATIWKNGIASSLTNSTEDSKAYCVFVSKNDVYVAGNIGNTATVWKNGISASLSDGKSPAVATSIFVK